MNKILSVKNFNIYSDGKDHFIVHNMRKPFNQGHTHINNFNTAKYIIYLAMYKKKPKGNHLSIYLIDSIIRLSVDEDYICTMQEFKNLMIERKNNKV